MENGLVRVGLGWTACTLCGGDAASTDRSKRLWWSVRFGVSERKKRRGGALATAQVKKARSGSQ
jgi:hypothetical protein